MTPDQAEDLAARTLTAIDDLAADVPVPLVLAASLADRERVASDLAGLRRCYRTLDVHGAGFLVANDLLPIFADGLRRTAHLYGVTE